MPPAARPLTSRIALPRSEPRMNAPSLQAEIRKQQPFDCPQQEAYLNLARTHSVLNAPFTALFKRHGLSEATYNVLRILRGAAKSGHSEGLPCLEVAERMITRVPDITRLVDRLIAAGLVTRNRSSDDRRVVRVAITSRGLDILKELDRPIRHLHCEQLAHLSSQDLAELNRLLELARDAAGAVGSFAEV